MGTLALLAGAACFHLTQGEASALPACGELTASHNGTVYKVLFAKNGAVQRYQLVHGTENTENDHDVLLSLQAKYGPEEVNAPPVQIVSYRDAGGGMRIPLKAVDSCGRVTEFK